VNESFFSEMVVGDEADINAVNFDWFAGTFDDSFSGPIDDVVIGYEIGEIDGLHGVLGYAGPTYVRNVGKLPVAGIMKFDIVDFNNMDKSDAELVILHEMGHVLGIGSLWETFFTCAAGCSGGDNEYDCAKANAEYAVINPNDPLVLQSSVCGHWAESNFDGMVHDELMTPYFEAHLYQPITRITVGALDDMGYVVDYSAADPYIPPRDTTLIPKSSFVLDDSRMKRPEVKVVP